MEGWPLAIVPEWEVSPLAGAVVNHRSSYEGNVWPNGSTTVLSVSGAV